MPAQKNLNGIFAKKLKQLDNSLDGFADVLNDVMNDLIIQMNGYVSAYRKGRELNVGELLKAVQAGQARDDIIEMLNQAGYGQLVNDFVDQYDEYTTEFLSRVFDEIDVPLSFTQADIELMDQLKGFDVQKALGVRDELAQGLSNGLAQMAMAGSSFTDTMAFMRTVPGAHAGHLKAQINTGMASFDAKIAGDKMVEAGIERYRYYGPVDSITRPFCRKVIEIQAERGGFTLEEIQGELTELRQSLGQAGGLAPDAFITRGGWNCRHSWGVFLEGEKPKEKAQFQDADEQAAEKFRLEYLKAIEKQHAKLNKAAERAHRQFDKVHELTKAGASLEELDRARKEADRLAHLSSRALDKWKEVKFGALYARPKITQDRRVWETGLTREPRGGWTKKDPTDSMLRGLDEFQKLVDDNVMPRQLSPEDKKISAVFLPKGKRAYYDPELETVAVTENVTTATVVHELGHWLEYHSFRVHEKAKAFYERRTAGDEPVSLKKLTGKNFRDNEFTRPDKFMDPYMGKFYPDQYNEIVSMGIQYLFEQPIEFAKGDPDYFRFMWRILRGR